MTAVLNPVEVERWLHGLGSLLPREAVAALADEVRDHDMDGEAFDALVASRAMPQLGDSVRPAHMATLRRCWHASKPPSSSASRRPSSCGSSSFAPPARVAKRPEPPQPARIEKERPAARPEPAWPESPEQSPGGLAAYNDETDLDAELISNVAEANVKRPMQVPRLDLTFIHRNAGHRGESAEELQRHQWKQPERRQAAPKTVASSSSAALLPPDGTSRISFSSASPEDQQRIA